MNHRHGFSLFEILISISLIVIVGGLVVVSMNPAGQLAKARNSERKADLQTILNSVRQNIADQRTGVFSCAAGDIPTSSKRMASSGTSTYDIAPCILPTYTYAVPYDPKTTGAHYTSLTDYDTGYYVIKNASTGQITLTAPGAELGQTISVTR